MFRARFWLSRFFAARFFSATGSDVATDSGIVFRFTPVEPTIRYVRVEPTIRFRRSPETEE
jgi:hypothetical protein